MTKSSKPTKATKAAKAAAQPPAAVPAAAPIEPAAEPATEQASGQADAAAEVPPTAPLEPPPPADDTTTDLPPVEAPRPDAAPIEPPAAAPIEPPAATASLLFSTTVVPGNVDQFLGYVDDAGRRIAPDDLFGGMDGVGTVVRARQRTNALIQRGGSKTRLMTLVWPAGEEVNRAVAVKAIAEARAAADG